MDDEGDLIGTSTVRGFLLLAGVATVAYLAYRYWQQLASQPKPIAHTISIPVGPPKRVPVQRSFPRAFHGYGY